MAYDASKTDDEQTVAGSTPLDQGSGQVAQPIEPTGDSAPTPTAPQVGASPIETQQQQTVSKKAPRASSGMFTNIQKYIQKNVPQAQKMSKAVTQDVSRQAADIRGAAEEKQQQTQAQIQANQAAMQQARTGAEQQIQAIIQPGAQPAPGIQQPIAPQAQDFQALMRGDIAGAAGVQDVNLAQQQMKAQALQNLAAGARTEQGRQNLLRGTFGDEGRYTRGMSALDQLIVGGDVAAREGLIGGVEQQVGGLQEQLRGIGQQTTQDIAAQRLAEQQFGGEIRGLAEAPLEQFKDIGTTVEGLRATDKEIQAMAVAPEEQAQLDESKTNIANMENELERQRKYLKEALEEESISYGGHGSAGSTQLEQKVKELEAQLGETQQIATQQEADINTRLEGAKATREGEYLQQLGQTETDISKYEALQRLLGGPQGEFDISELLKRYEKPPLELDGTSEVRTGGTLKAR